MENLTPTTPTMGNPGQLQFCSNCTRLVNRASSTPLNGPLTPSQKLNMEAEDQSQSQESTATAQVLQGCTILEALTLVCGVPEESGMICIRCQAGVQNMLKAFLAFVQFANKNSTELFRDLKTRTQPFIQRVEERRKILATLTQPDESVVPRPSEFVEMKLPHEKLKPRRRRTARKYKYSDRRLQNLLNYRNRNKIDSSLEIPEPLPPAQLDVLRSPETLSPPRTRKSIPVRRPKPESEHEPDSDSSDGSATAAPSPEPNKANDSEDEYSQTPVQVKMECNNSDEDGGDRNSLDAHDSDESPRTPIFDISTEIKRQPKSDTSDESDDDNDDSDKEYRYTPVKSVYSCRPPPPPAPIPAKKPRRILVRHPLPPELEPKQSPNRPQEKRYTCLQPDCGRQFALTSRFAEHLVTAHDMVKPFVCRLCDSVFLQKPHLTEHLKSHFGESGSCSCQVPGCGAVFTKSVNLKSHMKVVHCENKFHCDQCEKVFSQQCVLKKHILLMHSKDEIQKPFVCEDCGRRFVFAEYLRNHQKSHKTDRPYTCTTCNKTFKNTKGLKSHQVAHREDKPWVCQTCGRTFKTLGTLRTHGLSHKNQRNFRCSLPACSRSFNRKVHLIQHFKAVHKLEKPEADHLANKGHVHVRDREQPPALPISSSSRDRDPVAVATINDNQNRVAPIQLGLHRQQTSAEINSAVQNIPEVALAGFNTHYFTPW